MGGFMGNRDDGGAARREAERQRQEADRRRREAEAEQARLTKEKDDIARYRLSTKRRGRGGTILTSGEGLGTEEEIKKTLLGG